ncbi:MAG: hypothetical protein AAFQ71_11545 [Planctomycetota bacterium]
MTTITTQPKDRPIESVRSGSVVAAIWRNEHDGVARYNVTLERIYVDESGNWKSTGSFGFADMLRLAKVADMADTRIAAMINADRDQAKSGASPSKPANQGVDAQGRSKTNRGNAR